MSSRSGTLTSTSAPRPISTLGSEVGCTRMTGAALRSSTIVSNGTNPSQRAAFAALLWSQSQSRSVLRYSSPLGFTRPAVDTKA